MLSPAGTGRWQSSLTALAPWLFLLLWSAGFPIAKVALADASPLVVLSLRYAFSLLILFVLWLIIRPPLPTSAAAWRHLAVVGFLVQVLYFGLIYVSMSLGMSAGVSALIVSLQPLVIGLASPWFLGESVSRRQWLGLLLGFGGTILVVSAQTGTTSLSWLELLLAIGSLLGISGGMLYERRFGTAQHIVTANLVQYSVGLIVCAPLLMFEDSHLTITSSFSWALAYLVIGNSLIAVTLLLALSRVGRSAKVASLFFLVPPGAALLSFLILGERIALLAWPGMLVAIAGVALASRKN